MTWTDHVAHRQNSTVQSQAHLTVSQLSKAPSGPPPEASGSWQASDGNWYKAEQHPSYTGVAVGDSLSKAGRPRRVRLIVLSAIALAVAGVISGVLLAGGGTSSKTSVCSLLTDAQVRALIPGTHKLLVHGLSYPKTRQSDCTFVPVPFDSPVTSLDVVIGPAPHGFPSSALRHFAPPVSVDGRTAWWYNIFQEATPPGHQVPPEAHILLAVKDGREVGVQAETSDQPESLARRTMAEILEEI